MKKVINYLLCGIMVLSLAACSDNTGVSTDDINENCIEDIVEKGKLIVGVKDDVPGLSYYNEETGEYEGIEDDLAIKVAASIFECSEEEAKEYVEFVPVTVADRETKLYTGDIDLMIATYTITDERSLKFAVSEPYYTDYVGIMVEDSSNIKSIEDLDGKYIGVTKNSTTKDMFTVYKESDNLDITPIFIEYSTYDDLSDSLAAGDLDAMSVDISILNGYMNDTRTILEDQFGQQYYGAAALSENQKLIDIVNEVIK